jgi:hypothetical protein
MGTPFERPSNSQNATFYPPSNWVRTPLRTPFEHPSNGHVAHPPYTPLWVRRGSNPAPWGAGAGSNPSILNTGKGKRRSGAPSLDLSLPGVKNSQCGIRGGRPLEPVS